MKEILRVEVLKKSSVTGRNNWTPIPKDVYVAIQSNLYFIILIKHLNYLFFNYLNEYIFRIHQHWQKK